MVEYEGIKYKEYRIDASASDWMMEEKTMTVAGVKVIDPKSVDWFNTPWGMFQIHHCKHVDIGEGRRLMIAGNGCFLLIPKRYEG